MNSKQKREEIVALIDNIKEHSDRLSKMPHMPLLEVSAILSKINRLHENTVVLKYLLATEQHHEDEEFGFRLPKIEMDEEDELEEEEEPLDSAMEEDSESVEDYDDDQEQDDDLNVREDELELNSDYQDTDTQTATKKVSKIDIETMEEKSGMSSKSDINEQYADEQEDRSLSEQLKKQPIADLMAAIGLNERYLYANDLFGGDIEEFRKIIRLLNDFDNESEAANYFNSELRRTYGWEDDNELAEALFLLVRRRFQDNN